MLERAIGAIRAEKLLADDKRSGNDDKNNLIWQG
jgi:hypothetical protein